MWWVARLVKWLGVIKLLDLDQKINEQKISMTKLQRAKQAGK